MMRKTFDDQLADLNDELIFMGKQCEAAIASVSKALTDKDIDMAKSTMEHDSEIDQTEKNIESMCLKLLLSQQPVARDLRQISSALKMITDLERIGDQAADICEIIVLLANQTYIKKLDHINAMTAAASKMVTQSIDAYVRKDLELAGRVIAEDDIIDSLFVTIKTELIKLIAEDPSCGEQALDFLMIAKYLERIGDHATNVAEWAEFSILGKHPENKEKYSGSSL